jgi:hypothetical protein
MWKGPFGLRNAENDAVATACYDMNAGSYDMNSGYWSRQETHDIESYSLDSISNW